MQSIDLLLADVALVTHVLFVAFVIVGLIVTVVGGFRKWIWIRNPWFRITHLASIGFVVAQAYAGLICPLTTLEMWLRKIGGESHYEGSFIKHWLHELLYYDAPEWVFVAAYSLFGLLVVVAWGLFPPRFTARNRAANN